MNKQKIFLKKIIKKAGKRLLKEYLAFNRSGVRLKSYNEIVTKADLIANEIIINAIKKEFPAHQVLSEETGESKDKSDYLWIIDPLDGTTNFSIHNPLWSTSIALAYRGEIVLGAVYAPIQNELFVAEKNKGTYLNGRRTQVSKTLRGKNIHTFCHGQGKRNIKKALRYYRYQKLNGFDCRQLGSAAIELAYVASARIESIMIPGANSWDVAAGTLLVHEAGGRVSDFKGGEWSLSSQDMLATNGKEHREILGIINN